MCPFYFQFPIMPLHGRTFRHSSWLEYRNTVFYLRIRKSSFKNKRMISSNLQIICLYMLTQQGIELFQEQFCVSFLQHLVLLLQKQFHYKHHKICQIIVHVTNNTSCDKINLFIGPKEVVCCGLPPLNSQKVDQILYSRIHSISPQKNKDKSE